MAAKTLPDQEYLRQLFSYDRLTGIVLWRERPAWHFQRPYEFKRWNARYAGTRVANIRRPKDRPHWTVSLNGNFYPLHRVIWKLETNEEPPEIDHKDRDGLNNKWDNLRAATHAQNCRNRNRRRTKTSNLPIGVHRDGDKFKARLVVDGKCHYLGSFSTMDEASQAYAAAALAMHKEFAAVSS